MNSYSRTYAAVDLDAVAFNFESMRKNIREDTSMIAVIKADAYGHGAVPVARLLESYSYIWGYAVATAEEALELREAGIHKPILILGYVFEDYYADLIENQVRFPVFDYATAKCLSDTAAKKHLTALIHLALDTGMTRIGLKDNEESVEEVLQISKLPNLQIEGMFTHFARADEKDKTCANRQFHRYLAFRDRLEEAGIQIPICHCSNSAGIIDMPYANLDVVRAGITIYGIYPSDEVDKPTVPLHPVMEWKARVSFVKEVEAGVDQLWRNLYHSEKNVGSNNPGRICRWISTYAFEPGLCPDSRTQGSDTGTCMYGSVYGRCHRYPGCSEGNRSDPDGKRPGRGTACGGIIGAVSEISV